MHSSEQINKLILNNQNKNNSDDVNNLMLSHHDDQSIYKKIYNNDDTETLKSVENDLNANYFSHQISPSQFNIQNQRFDETDISQTENIPEKPIVHI